MGADRLDVLVALLGRELGGFELAARLQELGTPVGPAALLGMLLSLERAGYVDVRRQGEYRFGLTPSGEEAAYTTGPAQRIDVVVVMADLVDFVAYTDRSGDAAAHLAARGLADAADAACRRAGGQLVKLLGDGVLASLPATADPVGVLRSVAQRCATGDGAWSLRAAAHRGRPIRVGADLFGQDVNLVARLCPCAAPGEVVVTTTEEGAVEHLRVRGVATAVPVVRHRLMALSS